jgi:hypothetical protein
LYIHSEKKKRSYESLPQKPHKMATPELLVLVYPALHALVFDDVHYTNYQNEEEDYHTNF